MRHGTNFYIYSGIAFIALLVFSPQSRGEESCAKLTFEPAEKCENIRVTLDVSSCSDSLSSPPKVKCSGKQAKIKATGTANRYSAVLKAEESAWGIKNWAVIGLVEVETKNKKNKAKAESQNSAPTGHANRDFASAPMPTPPATKRAPKEETPAASADAADADASSGRQPASTGTWSFSAIFDGYYSYNFNRPAPATPISATSVDTATIRPAQNSLRPYDWYSRQFGLNLLEFSPKFTMNNVTFFADLDFGQMADINAATAAGTGYVVDEVSKHIGQAVLSISPSGVPGLVIEVGKMATHLGLEVTKARDNWNYTRSVNYGFGIPFWHTGVHLGYAVIPEKLITSLYLYNGWNTITDINSAPTVGAQVKFLPSPSTTLIYNYIGGPEQAANNSNRKEVHEANATLGLSSSLSLGLEALYGSEESVTAGTLTGKAIWKGASIASKWQASPTYALTPRFELYRDNLGYTVGNGEQTIRTFTLTNSFQLGKGLETRLEGRLDKSTAARFLKHGASTKNQTTATVSLLYSM